MKIEQFLSERYKKGSFLRVVQKFLTEREEELAPTSLTHLLYTLRPCGIALNNPRIKKLKPRDLKKYVNELWLKYSPGTIRPMIGDLQQFGRWCVEKGHTKKNIARLLKKPRLRTNQPDKAPPYADVLKIMVHLSNQIRPFVFRNLFGELDYEASHQWSQRDLRVLRDMFIISILYESGCRAGELCNLSKQAMDQATAKPANSYTIVTGIGKTNDHDYYFTHTTAKLWHLWVKLHPDKQNLYAIYGWKNGGEYEPLLTNGISQMLIRRCDQAKVPRFRAHALRHAKIKRSRQIVGMDLAQILVDHADVETTWGYAGVDDKELEQAVISTGLCYDLWE